MDNGQVAVFGALANGSFCAPVDARLYLSEEWTMDSDCCMQADKHGRFASNYQVAHRGKEVREVVRLPNEEMESLGSPYGNCHDGYAVYVHRMHSP